MYASSDCTGTDLCLAGTASASSEYSSTYSAAKANDNNGSTRWSTTNPASSGQWWKINFGMEKSVHSMKLLISGYQIAKTVYLEASKDGNTWVTKATLNPPNNPQTLVYTNL